MNTKKTEKATLLSSVIAIFAPLLCCWGPALLISIAGISGGAAYFSWITPLRPYLFGFAFTSLGYSFYKAYKPRTCESGSCSCDKEQKPGFLKSKLYLWVVAMIVIIMFLLFNFYPSLILPD